MTTHTDPLVEQVNWGRVVFGGLAAGLIVNAFEYGGHRVFLDDAWTAAFRALGKTPTGWSMFIPGNFVVGILMVWLYARLRPRYGAGPKTALRSGLAVWVVFWVIPMMAMMPMDLFPNGLLAIVIVLGLVDANLAVLLGAFLYKGKSTPAAPLSAAQHARQRDGGGQTLSAGCWSSITFMPACSKCRSVVSASVSWRCSITTKDRQSVRLQLLSDLVR